MDSFGGWTDLCRQFSALLLTWGRQQLLRVATDLGSGSPVRRGGVAGVLTLLTSQVGWSGLSPCTVSGFIGAPARLWLAVERNTHVFTECAPACSPTSIITFKAVLLSIAV